jgi:hypothetical protein
MTALLPALFALTSFVAAGLLFSVQPMIARIVLPRLGGAPAVWTTCMLFFQVALLAGYGYAHVATDRLGVRRQTVVHPPLLLLSFLFLPIAASPGSASQWFEPASDPTWKLLGWLARTAGLPFFTVATTAPLLQCWFAATGHRSSRDPYFLYAASNAGSFAALVGYPLWVERRLRLVEQSAAWSAGFGVLAVLVALCAALTFSRCLAPGQAGDGTRGAVAVPGDWLGWVILALIPSSLMLGLTTYLTTDLAAIPLLWVVPLGLYLLSFVLVFSLRAGSAVGWMGRLLPLLVMVQAPLMGAGLVQPFWIPVHLLTFFAAAVVCHGELARRRPPASRLTEFYLALAVGGALGGIFNALVAPVLFDRVVEYPLALVAACLVLAFRGDPQHLAAFQGREVVLPLVIGLTAAALCANVGGVAETGVGVVATMASAGLTVLVAVGHRRHPVRFALTVGALLLAAGLAEGVSGRVIHRERSFFGVLKVTEVGGGEVHRLFHGSTLHGQQNLDPARRREPSTYFDRSGPIGQVFAVFNVRPGREGARVAVTGLGVGSLASYARPGQRWSFFEIDPAVVRIARDPRFFTYLGDSLASSLDVVPGDARLKMARNPDGGFDLIILDAFSSDAIPIHLITREALSLNRRKLADGGLIVVNISNRYLDLAPVVALLARDAGLVCRVRIDASVSPAEKAAGKQGSIWAVLAARETDLGDLAGDPLWSTPPVKPGDTVWTDDFSSLLGHFRLGPVPTGRGSLQRPSRPPGDERDHR